MEREPVPENEESAGYFNVSVNGGINFWKNTQTY